MSTEVGSTMNRLLQIVSESNNGWGKRGLIDPPLPLTFDRVMENRPPTTTARLFKMPIEILALILKYVDSSFLAALALVNSNCGQLARSRYLVIFLGAPILKACQTLYVLEAYRLFWDNLQTILDRLSNILLA
jgi:hypothetical protein